MSVSDYSKKKSAPETALQRYYRLKNERQYKTDMTQQQTVQPVRETPAEEQNKGGFLGGIGYGLEKLGLGIVRGLEGVADYIVAGGADLFGQDEYAEKVMTDDWMNYNHADEWYNPSEGWQTVGDITGSIGQMLPSVAAAAIPYVGPALSTGMFMTSAAGNAVSEAAKESGELGGKEWLYGSLSGAAEGAVEKVSGGIGGTAAGKVLGRQLGKTTLGKLGVTFAGEGLEEVASDLIDPALRRVTGVDKDATVDWEQLPKTFLVGGAAGSVMGAGTRAVNAARVGGFNNLNAIERTAAVNEGNAELNRRAAQGRNTERSEAYVTDMRKRLERSLKKMDADTRARFFAEHPTINNTFNADGSMKAAAQVSNPAAVSAAYRNAAPSYYQRTQTLKNGNTRTLTLTPTKKTIRPEVQTALNDAVRLTDGRVNYVVTDNIGKGVNGFYDRDSSTVYISSRASAQEAARAIVSHEITHTLEGTKEYAALAEYALKSMAGREEYSPGRYLTAYAEAHPNVNADTLKYIVDTERVADYIGKELLSNEQTVRRLVESHESIARRIYNWIKDKLAILTKRGGDRETARELSRALKLYENALRHSVGGVSLDAVQAATEARNARTERTAERERNAKRTLTPAAQGGRFSIRTIDGESVVVIDTDQDIFEGADVKDYPKIVRKYMLDKFQGKVFPIGTSSAFVNRNSVNEYTFPANRRQGTDNKTQKMRAGTELDNLLKVGEYIRHEADDGRHPDATRGWDYYKTRFAFDGENIYEGIISIKLIDRGDLFYDITKIENTSAARTAGIAKGNSSVSDRGASTTSIPQKEDLSTPEAKKDENIRYSLAKDSTGQGLTEAGDSLIPDGVAAESESNGNIRYNLATYEESGRTKLKALLSKRGFANGDIEAALAVMDDIAAFTKSLETTYSSLVDWNATKAIYDEKTGQSVYTVMVKNGDYPLNIDLSTICKKRIAITKVMNELVRRNMIEDVSLSPENIVKINQILKENGYETACPACFVESKRYGIEAWAERFVNDWNSVVKKVSVNAGTLDFANGKYTAGTERIDTAALDDIIENNKKREIRRMATVIRNNPSLCGYMKKGDLIGNKGLDAIKQHSAELYSSILNRSGVGTPKPVQQVVPYNSELTAYQHLAKDAKKVGGVRMFSFSDFTIDQFFDYAQIVADLYAQEATMHTYTKEITFAELFGMTGIKINLSMIPAVDRSLGKDRAGLDADGNLIWSKYGVDFDTASALMRKAGYNGNVGTATIGVSDSHIRKLLDTPETNYIIPYHKSGLRKVIAKLTDIDMYTDYTLQQNTRDKSGKKLSASEAAGFNFFEELEKAKDARRMADNYLAWCDENGYIPKFEQFRNHRNYYKLLVDFQVYKTVDGKEVYAPQETVQLKFPDNFGEIVNSALGTQSELNAERDKNFNSVMAQIEEQIKRPQKSPAGSDSDIRYSLKKPMSQSATEAERITAELTDRLRNEYHLNAAEVTSISAVVRKDVQAALAKKNMQKGLYTHLYKKFREKYWTEIRTRRYRNSILNTARTARDMLNRKGYVSARVLENEDLKGYLKFVANLKGGADIKADVRERVAALKKVYNKDNFALYDENAITGSELDENIVAAIDLVAENAGSKAALTADELRAIDVITKGLVHLYKNYDLMWRGDSTVSVRETADRGVEVLQATARRRQRNTVWQWIKNRINAAGSQMLEPTSVMRQLDSYADNGVMTELFEDVKRGEIEAAVNELHLLQPLEAFYKAHKGYKKRLTDTKVRLGDAEITLDEAMYVYLLSFREQAHLSDAGVTVTDKNGFTRKISGDHIHIGDIESAFNADDKAYVELMRKLFNEDARDLKAETDRKLYGYTVLEDGDNYVPIYRDRAGIAMRMGDPKGYLNDVATAFNLSFNKATVKNAKLPISLYGITEVAARHARGIGIYSGLTIPIKNFNRVYNNVTDERPTSMRETMNHRVWNGAEAYLKKLFNDIQGVGRSTSAADRALTYVRGVYAKYQLGANIKTVLSQTASYPMAFVYLDADCLTRAFAMKPDKAAMFEYAPMTEQRMTDRAVVKAQSLSDRIGRIGDLATKPIQMMDNAVVRRLWAASQLHVEKHTGHKVGTEANLRAAGELLTKVVRETQSNYLTTERSAMNRSNNFLVSSLTMFMSDATKQFSRLFDAVGELSVRRDAFRAEATEANRTAYRQAQKKLGRAVTAVTVSNLHYVLMGLLVKFLFNRIEDDDKDGSTVDEYLKDFGKEFGGSMLGLFPVVRDVYGYFTDGFELNNYALGMLNDMLKATKSMGTLAGDILSGKPMETSEMMRPIRELLYAVGMGTGIPVRNTYNLVYGLVKRFDPATAYKANALFYDNTAFKADIQYAQEQGNTRLAEAIAHTETVNRTGWDDTAVVTEVSRLLGAGYSVLPGKVGETLTVNGVEQELTGKQQKALQEAYNASEAALGSLFRSSGYAALDDTGKARAARYVQDYFTALGKSTVLGIAMPSKYYLYELLGADVAALHLSVIAGIEADKDKAGNTVANSRKSKVHDYIESQRLTALQKYILLILAGYKPAEAGKDQVRRAINRLSVSQDVKADLLELVD